MIGHIKGFFLFYFFYTPCNLYYKEEVVYDQQWGRVLLVTKSKHCAHLSCQNQPSKIPKRGRFIK